MLQAALNDARAEASGVVARLSGRGGALGAGRAHQGAPCLGQRSCTVATGGGADCSAVGVSLYCAREPHQAWQVVPSGALSCGGRDGTRTRTPLRTADFLHTAPFDAKPKGPVCALDHAFTVAPLSRCGRRPPSGLYTFPFGLRSALPRRVPGGSPNLTGFTQALSPPGAQIS